MDETVWVIETGDYEQRVVMGVAVSPAAAEAYVRGVYGAPYRVEWQVDESGMFGRFEAVPGYSTRHTARYDFMEMPLHTAVLSTA